MANYLTTTQNDYFIPEIVANQLLGALGSYLNLGRTVTKDSELTSQSYGDVINVAKRGTLSANDKTQGSNVTVQQPSLSRVQVTLNNHKEVTIGEEDYTRSLQPGSTLPGYVEDGVIAIGEAIETALANLWPDLSATFNNDTSSDKLQDLIDARTAMVKNKVPQTARKYAYLNPDFVGALLKSSAFIDPKVIPNNQALTEGAVGRAAGFDVFEGQLVATSGSPKTFRNMVYTRNAMVLATRPLPQPDGNLGVQSASVLDGNGIALRVLRSYNATQLATQITIDVLFGVAALDARQGGVIDHRP